MELFFRQIDRITTDDEYWKVRSEVEAVLFSDSAGQKDRLWADLVLSMIEHYEETRPALDYGESVPLAAFLRELAALSDELPEGIEDPWQYVKDNPEE